MLSNGRLIPKCDVAIVTGWQTAELVPLFRGRARRVLQIAYDYEVWMSSDLALRARMARAFMYADAVIGTSGAVNRMLLELGRAPLLTIPCGLDLDAFRVMRDPARRRPSIGFIARSEATKRMGDAVDALALVRSRVSDVNTVAVGSARAALPAWIESWDAPDDRAMCYFYNSLSVLMLPSVYEGWGLPAAEAMACGTAVVSTRNGGVEDFAVHGVNALLVPACNPEALAGACVALLRDDALRRLLVSGGVRSARMMDWARSVDALEKVLMSI